MKKSAAEPLIIASEADPRWQCASKALCTIAVGYFARVDRSHEYIASVDDLDDGCQIKLSLTSKIAIQIGTDVIALNPDSTSVRQPFLGNPFSPEVEKLQRMADSAWYSSKAELLSQIRTGGFSLAARIDTPFAPSFQTLPRASVRWLTPVEWKTGIFKAFDRLLFELHIVSETTPNFGKLTDEMRDTLLVAWRLKQEGKFTRKKMANYALVCQVCAAEEIKTSEPTARRAIALIEDMERRGMAPPTETLSDIV